MGAAGVSILVAAALVAGAAAASARAGDPLAPLAGRTIALDPGHNPGNFSHPDEIGRLVDAGTLRKPCNTTGTATRSGYLEATFALDVAYRLRRLLRQAGARVVLTHDRGGPAWGPCVDERAAIANRASADAALSIHADGHAGPGRGFHVIYPPSIRGLTDDIARPSRRLAIAIRDAYRAGTGLPYATYTGERGLNVRSDLGGLNLADVPAVFIETGNMRDSIDAGLLESPAFRQRIARALARGLAAFVARR